MKGNYYGLSDHIIFTRAEKEKYLAAGLSEEYIKKFYDDPIEAVHCFYGIVGFWDVTSTIIDNDPEDYDVQLVSQQNGRISEQIKIKPKHKPEFKKYIENLTM